MSNLFNVGTQVPMEVDSPVESTKTSCPFDIQVGSCVKINPEHLVELKKGEKVESLPGKKKKVCKVLKFSSKWTFKDAIDEISRLNPDDHPNLFVFIIEASFVSESNFEPHHEQKKRRKIDEQNVKNHLEEKLIKFLESRQVLIQLTAGSENEIKSFYNQTDSMEKLHEVTWNVSGGESNDEFSVFLRNFLKLQHEASTDKFENSIFDLLESPDELSLRFLTIFDFSFDFSFRVASHSAANLSKSHFLAAMGFQNEDDVWTNTQDKLISSTFEAYEFKSILEAALAGEYSDVVEFIINNCYCIKNLPKDHQIEIANQLVVRSEYDVLCDLLDMCDFAFPTGTNLADIAHEGFHSIVGERQEFHEAIKHENYEAKIDEFRKENQYLDIAYNINNESALYTALKNDKGKTFIYLKKKGFIATESNIDYNKLMLLNIELYSFNPEQTVNSLISRSRIYGKNVDYHEQILDVKEWLTAIYKTDLGRHLLDAASQCDNLRIVFDFNRTNVEGVDLNSKDANGIFYPSDDLVIIAARHSSNSKKKQDVKGVLAHELTHFVIRKLFQNRSKPYYNVLDPRYQKYKNIVQQYKHLKNVNYKTDECEGIISLVYHQYEEEEYDAELIVRPFQILARYDENPEKVEELKEKYPDLFEFGFSDVVPEMKKLNLSQFEFVKIFNDFSGLLSSICKKNLELSVSNAVKSLLDKNKLTVVTSNVPKLFLIEAYNHLKELFGNLAGSKNVFVTQKCLEKEKIRNHLKVLLERNQELKAFVDFSGGNFDILKYLKGSFERCFVIVVSDEGRSKEVARVLEKEGLKSEELTIDYKWEKLVSAQSKLLQYEVNFQNQHNTSLQKLFVNELDLSNVIDCKTLNMILNHQNIHLNIDIGLKRSIEFEFLYLKRGFFKCEKRKEVQEDNDLLDEKDEARKSNKTEFKDEIEKTLVKSKKLFDEPIVLISDVAGSGKSWVMRSLAIELARSKSTHWVTFVDLKQFIPYFKETKKVPNFHAFIVEKVLEKKTKFELEMFKLKYENGEAAIFFDGFDEIAPTCAEYVRKIIKTFNFSNQLFISTRDYFEVDLQKDLKVNFAYKLDALSEKEGVDLIARIWRLNDFENLENVELQRDIIGSKEYKNYINLAEKLMNTIEKLKASDIGLPQIYSMIAKITKDKKKLDGSLNTYQLYLRMYEMTYEEWSTKNELRKEVNVKKQQSKMNFLKLHELKALQSFKPGKSKYCDINPRYKWEEVLVDGCGILAKREKDFVFIHETFYEFFVAEFILRNLRHLETAAEAFEYMQGPIIGYDYKIIRKFLNEGIQLEKNESLYDENIFDVELRDERFELLAKNVNKSLISSENICDIFVRYLRDYDCIGDFLMEVLQKSDMKLEDMIKKELIPFTSYEGKINLEKLQKRLIELIKSKLDLQTLVNATKKLNENVVRDSLRNKDDKFGWNIFWNLTLEEVEKEENFEKFLAFLKSFLTPREIADLMKERHKYDRNVFHSWRLRENISEFEVFFRGFKKFFIDELSFDDFKAILMQKDEIGRNVIFNILVFIDFNQADQRKRFWNLILETFENDKKGLHEIIMERNSDGENCLQKLLNSIHMAEIGKYSKILKEFVTEDTGDAYHPTILFLHTKCEDKNCHVTLLNFLVNCFENRDDFLKFLMRTTDERCEKRNFIEKLIKEDETGKVVGIVLETLKSILNENQFVEILMSKDFIFHQNLLHLAFVKSKNIQTVKSVWKFYEENLDNFFEVIFEVAEYGQNIINNAAKSASAEILDFLCEKLKNLNENEKVKKAILSRSDLLINAAWVNESKESHESLWKLLYTFLDKNDILTMVNFIGYKGQNVLQIAIEENTPEVVEFIRGQIKALITDEGSKPSGIFTPS